MSFDLAFAARAGTLQLGIAMSTTSRRVALVGPNGAGKTTTLRALLGLLPVEGRVGVAGVTLRDDRAGVDVPVEERRLGWVPQDYALLPHMTVRQNVAFAARVSRGGSVEAPERVDGLLRRFGLEALSARRPRGLSGGERQRVALARALATQPRALLLDEPLAAFDLAARGLVRDLLRGWLDEAGLPALLVTHDPGDARALTDTVAFVEAGRLTQWGTWSEVEASPATPYAAAFVAAGR